MNWDYVLTGYALFLLIVGTLVALRIVYDLLIGRYRRLSKRRDDFDKDEQDRRRRDDRTDSR